MEKIKLLFLCTGNSCRSQMAEGFTRHLRGDRIEVFSAGVETHGLNPLAVKVMAEAGIDISGHASTHIDELKGIPMDYVITVCSHAHETCPWFPSAARVIHREFDDPPRLAENCATEEEKLDCFRKVRDDIRDYVLTLPEALTQAP